MFCVGFIVVVIEARKPHGYTYAQLTQECEKPASVSKYMEVKKGHMNITINIQNLEKDNNSQCNFTF
jgi:hypothetical protein